MQYIKLSSFKFFLIGLFALLAFSANAADKDSQKARAHANELFHSQSPGEGNANGNVVIVDFFDYQCRHCGELSRTLTELVKKDSNVRVIFKELPILGYESEYATKAALAAAKQNKYLEFHNRLMGLDTSFDQEQVLNTAKQAGLDMTQLKHDMSGKAVAHEIKANLMLSQKLGIHGTPTLVIAKNANDLKDEKIYIISGALSEEEIKDILKKVRGG